MHLIFCALNRSQCTVPDLFAVNTRTSKCIGCPGGSSRQSHCSCRLNPNMGRMAVRERRVERIPERGIWTAKFYHSRQTVPYTSGFVHSLTILSTILDVFRLHPGLIRYFGRADELDLDDPEYSRCCVGCCKCEKKVSQLVLKVPPH